VMSRFLVYVAAGVVLFGALLLVTDGPKTGLIAVGLVLCLLAMVVVGPERMGVLAIAAAFLTAPMYKRLAPAGTPVTPTDLALVAGFALMLPRLLRNKFDLPVQYVVSVGVIFATGLIGSFVAPIPLFALVALFFWLSTMFVLPVGVHLWRPSSNEIRAMCWLFVIGQGFSFAYGIATGASAGGRFYGLTIHPNYFGEAGLISFGLLLHLTTVTPKKWRWIVWAAMAFSVYTIFISGSRAGMLGLAAILAIIPIVERSAVRVYFLALGAAGLAVYLSQNTRLLTQGALGRLLGHGTATGSDEARTRGLRYGWERFLDHPLSGSGLVDLFDVHNNYLEAAMGVGIFGFTAFMIVLYTLVRPLVGTHPLRRLCYPVFAYGVFGATTPSLYDRTFWVAMSLSIVVVVASRRPTPEAEPQTGRDTGSGTGSGAGPDTGEPAPARHLALVPTGASRNGGVR
jgi:O-antigen ligase